MNVIVTEGLYDREYVEQHGFGFEHFKAEVATRTPEWAYPETGIAPELIARRRASWRATAPRHWCTRAGARPGTATTRSADVPLHC